VQHLRKSFNGHPPLGVNATVAELPRGRCVVRSFQWAPTLGGECYDLNRKVYDLTKQAVSMGTHPWG